MTAAGFRRLALGLKETTEGAHMKHADFRVGGRIFASLHPSGQRGMVKLTPDEQERFIKEFPKVFAPESGAWGRQGYTVVHLALVDEETLGEALTLAARGAAAAAAPRKKTPSASPPRRRP